MKTVIFVLLDQYADWEAAPLASVISGTPGWHVKTVAPEGKPVYSMGGFTTVPESNIPQILPDDCAGVVLIGGMSWRSEAARQVEPLVKLAVERGLVIGAICDATVFLGKLGLLNDASHTSNMLQDLQAYAGSNYTGASFYRNEPAVQSGNLITANGTAAMDFAREMLAALGILPQEDASKWYRLFKFGFYEAPHEAAWWFSRMNSASC